MATESYSLLKRNSSIEGFKARKEHGIYRSVFSRVICYSRVICAGIKLKWKEVIVVGVHNRCAEHFQRYMLC